MVLKGYNEMKGHVNEETWVANEGSDFDCLRFLQILREIIFWIIMTGFYKKEKWNTHDPRINITVFILLLPSLLCA